MAPLGVWKRYLDCKLLYSLNLFEKTHGRIRSMDGHIKYMPTLLQFSQLRLKSVFMGNLTFLHRNKAEEMASPTGSNDVTYLVRRIPYAYTVNTFVGDMVVLKDPMKPQKYLVRRIAAVEGDEMASGDEKDEPFVLEENECWVLADNEAAKPEGSYDSRSFGPVSMKDIVGRAIYVLRNDGENGPVNNSHRSMSDDKPVLEVELDVEEMKNHNN